MQSLTFAYRLLPLHKLFLLQYAAQRQRQCDVAGKCQSRGRADDDRDGRRGLGGSRGLDAGVQLADSPVAVDTDVGDQAGIALIILIAFFAGGSGGFYTEGSPSFTIVIGNIPQIIFADFQLRTANGGGIKPIGGEGGVLRDGGVEIEGRTISCAHPMGQRVMR